MFSGRYRQEKAMGEWCTSEAGRGASLESAERRFEHWLVLGPVQRHLPPPGPDCSLQPKGPQTDAFITVNGQQFLGLRNIFGLVSVEQKDYFHTLAMLFQTEPFLVMVSGMM